MGQKITILQVRKLLQLKNNLIQSIRNKNKACKMIKKYIYITAIYICHIALAITRATK